MYVLVCYAGQFVKWPVFTDVTFFSSLTLQALEKFPLLLKVAHCLEVSRKKFSVQHNWASTHPGKQCSCHRMNRFTELQLFLYLLCSGELRRPLVFTSIKHESLTWTRFSFRFKSCSVTSVPFAFCFSIAVIEEMVVQKPKSGFANSLQLLLEVCLHSKSGNSELRTASAPCQLQVSKNAKEHH